MTKSTIGTTAIFGLSIALSLILAEFAIGLSFHHPDLSPDRRKGL